MKNKDWLKLNTVIFEIGIAGDRLKYITNEPDIKTSKTEMQDLISDIVSCALQARGIMKSIKIRDGRLFENKLTKTVISNMEITQI